MILVISLLFWGMVLVTVPTLIRCFFELPQMFTVGSETVMLILIIIAGILYKSATSGRIRFHFYHYREKFQKTRRIFGYCLVLMHILGIMYALMVIFTKQMYQGFVLWTAFMVKYSKQFQIAQYIGIVMIAIAMGIAIGILYQKKHQIAQYQEDDESTNEAKDPEEELSLEPEKESEPKEESNWEPEKEPEPEEESNWEPEEEPESEEESEIEDRLKILDKMDWEFFKDEDETEEESIWESKDEQEEKSEGETEKVPQQKEIEIPSFLKR